MDVAGLSLPLVFAAGLVSFISPCVLPLLPGYLSTVSGVSFEQMATRERGIGRAVGSASALFFLGFLAVFVALGASASVIGELLTQHRLRSRTGGAVHHCRLRLHPRARRLQTPAAPLPHGRAPGRRPARRDGRTASERLPVHPQHLRAARPLLGAPGLVEEPLIKAEDP